MTLKHEDKIESVALVSVFTKKKFEIGSFTNNL